MSDNTTLPALGEVIATDDISGVKYQRVKIVHGENGVNDGDVSLSNPLPIKKSAPASSSISHVAVSTASDVIILASNTNRKGAIIENNSTGILYLLLGTGITSSSNRSLAIAASDTFLLENGDYTGIIRGIWESDSSGNANITEFI